ncbi:unnamed protein product [Closterium sp. Naga37s-1]|nr:unnamed protein product [Closterium sp. Naga37s-1]
MTRTANNKNSKYALGLVVSVRRSSTRASGTETTPHGTLSDVTLLKPLAVTDKIATEGAGESLARRRQLAGFETYDIRRVREWVVAHNRIRHLHSPLPPFLWDPALARFAQAHADSVGANAQCRPEANEAAGEAGLGEVYLWAAVEKGEALFTAAEAVTAWAEQVRKWGQLIYAGGSGGGVSVGCGGEGGGVIHCCRGGASVGGAAAEAVESWAEQGKHYSSSTGACVEGEDCSAFIQLTWKDTRRVGCGEALCPYKANFTGVVQFIVCNYYPPAALIHPRLLPSLNPISSPGALSLQGQFHRAGSIHRLQLLSTCCPSLPAANAIPFPIPRPSLPFPCQALCPFKTSFTGVAQFLVCNYYPPAPYSPSASIPQPHPLTRRSVPTRPISPGWLNPSSAITTHLLPSLPAADAIPFLIPHPALCPYKANFTGVAQFLVCNYYPPAALL